MVAGVAAVFLLLALAVGLLARSRIEAHTRLSMAASNRKLGLLVETVEGAECIKSQGSGWSFLNRWNALSEQGIAEDAKVRHSSESATYWAGFLQQVSYVMLIAVGAWIASTTRASSSALGPLAARSATISSTSVKKESTAPVCICTSAIR